MAKKPGKAGRWLDIVASLVQYRYPIPTNRLWQLVPAYRPGLTDDPKLKESVRRTFERDKKELAELGIPIETHMGSDDQAKYKLANKRDLLLPYLNLIRQASEETGGPGPVSGQPFELSEKEAVWVLEGLRELATVPGFPLAREARSAFRKFAFDLPSDLPDDPPVLYADSPEAAENAKKLKKLFTALTYRKKVEFDYKGIDRDEITSRKVSPYGFSFVHGRWYLTGHDELRNDKRTFRLSRLYNLKVNSKSPNTPDYEISADYTPAHKDRKAWELADKDATSEVATVGLKEARALWAERGKLGRCIKKQNDGSQTREFKVYRRDPFLRWILSMAGDAWIESPPDLGQDLQKIGNRVMELYGDSDSPDGDRR